MVHSVTTDRRQSKRHLVVGTVVIEAGQKEIEAELVNIGSGGLLAFCDVNLAIGQPVSLRFTVQDYPLLVRVPAFVAHTAIGLVGFRFSEQSETLDEILVWLEAGFMACLI